MLIPLPLVVWAHKVNDRDWSEQSYHKLYEITTAQEMWECINTMYEFIEQLMFFVMVDGAIPRWEHESNKNGGYFSVRVDAKNTRAVFETMMCRMVSNTFLREGMSHDDSRVVGLSTSNKGKFSIIKAWMSTCDVTDANAVAIDGVQRSMIRFTPHVGKACGGGERV